MVLFKLLDKGIGLVSTLLLARLLVPGDFGLVAMATSLIALLEVFGAFGFDIALIHRQSPTRSHFDTAWTFNVIVGLCVAALLLALALPVSHYYRQVNLPPVICALAVASAVQGFENVGVVAFRKEMQFHREFRYLLTKRIAAFLVTVSLALWLRSYWALVAGAITGRIAGVALSYWLHPYRPRFSLAARADLLHFSRWVLIGNILAFLKERSPDFVIGRIAGPSALGVFNVSAEIANLPGTELVAPINRAIFPAYARLAGDREALRTEYLSVMSVVCLIAVPAIAGIAATAKLLVAVLLGPKWLEAQHILPVLAFFGITQVMQSNAYAAYLALGRPDLSARITSIHVAILLGALIVFTRWYGLMGAAIAYLLTAVLVLPITFAFVFRLIDLRARAFFGVVWRPLLAALGMYLIVAGVVNVVSRAGHGTGLNALNLIGVILLGIASYAIMVLALWLVSGRPEGAERLLLRQLQGILSRRGLGNRPAGPTGNGGGVSGSG